jgi:hypothetical protein
MNQTVANGQGLSNARGAVISTANPETGEFARLVIANGGVPLTAIEIRAMEYWVNAYKQYNLWDRVVAYYPFVGSGSGATAYIPTSFNLKNPSSYRLNFNTLPTFEAQGLSYASADANNYATTGITPNGQMPNNTGCLSYYANLASPYLGLQFDRQLVDMGTLTNTGNGGTFIAARTNLPNAGNFASFGTIVGNFGNVNSRAFSTLGTNYQVGFLSTSRYNGIPGGTLTAHSNGNIIQSFTGFTYTDTAGVNDISLFNCSGDFNYQFPSGKRYCSFFIGSNGYTPQEELQRFLIERNFQRLLNRAI